MHRKINDFFDLSLPRLITLPWGWLYLVLAWMCTAYMVYYHQPFGEQDAELPFFRGILFGFTGAGIDLYLLLFLTMPRLFDPFLNCTRWTVGREISHLLLYYFLLLVFIQVYVSRSVHLSENPGLFHVFMFTFQSFILPVAGLTFFRFTFFLSQQRLSPEIVGESDPESIPDQMLDLTALHGDIYPVETIMYFKVTGNYCYMNYSSNGRQVEKDLKISLIKMQDLLKPYPQFVKCHNRYVVNTAKILKFSGTKRNMTLRLQNCKTKLPVSRIHAEKFIELISIRDSKSSEK